MSSKLKCERVTTTFAAFPGCIALLEMETKSDTQFYAFGLEGCVQHFLILGHACPPSPEDFFFIMKACEVSVTFPHIYEV